MRRTLSCTPSSSSSMDRSSALRVGLTESTVGEKLRIELFVVMEEGCVVVSVSAVPSLPVLPVPPLVARSVLITVEGRSFREPIELERPLRTAGAASGATAGACSTASTGMTDLVSEQKYGKGMSDMHSLCSDSSATSAASASTFTFVNTSSFTTTSILSSCSALLALVVLSVGLGARLFFTM